MANGIGNGDVGGNGITATAEVVRGGNRRVEVRVPVAIRDRRGNPWWEGVAVAALDLPAGADLPEVHADGLPELREVPRGG